MHRLCLRNYWKCFKILFLIFNYLFKIISFVQKIHTTLTMQNVFKNVIFFLYFLNI